MRKLLILFVIMALAIVVLPGAAQAEAPKTAPAVD